ncbi:MULTISPECIES: hypothetical protein [Achromobacter]|nr:hypothetical protein ELS24_16705 [Achromobacter spanius]
MPFARNPSCSRCVVADVVSNSTVA